MKSSLVELKIIIKIELQVLNVPSPYYSELYLLNTKLRIFNPLH